VSELSPVEKHPRYYAFGLYYTVTAMLGIIGGALITYTFGLSIIISAIITIMIGVWFYRSMDRLDRG